MLNHRTICIIEDGVITTGMAFEAINHAGATKFNILIILNDNNISITENVGSLNNYYVQKKYTQLLNQIQNIY